MLIHTPQGVRHTGRTEPQSTLVPAKREVAKALKQIADKLEQEGLNTPEMAEALDILWTHFVTR